MKKRRLERELEREARDMEREDLQRDKEAEYFSAWEKQEDTVGTTGHKLYCCYLLRTSMGKQIF